MAGFIKEILHGVAQGLPSTIQNANEYALRSRNLANQEMANAIQAKNVRELSKNREEQRKLGMLNFYSDVFRLQDPRQRKAALKGARGAFPEAKDFIDAAENLTDEDLVVLQDIAINDPKGLSDKIDSATRSGKLGLTKWLLEIQDERLARDKTQAEIDKLRAGIGIGGDLTGDAKNRFNAIRAANPDIDINVAVQQAVQQADDAKLQRSREQGTFKEKQTESTISGAINELDPLVVSVFQAKDFKGRIGEALQNMVGFVTQEGARAEDLTIYRDLKNSIAGQFAKVISGEGGRLTDQDIARVLGLFPREFGTAFLPDKANVAKRKMAIFHESLNRMRREILARDGIRAKGDISEAFNRIIIEPKTQDLIDIGDRNIEDLTIEELKALKQGRR